MASYCSLRWTGMRARAQAADERTASKWPSIADGARFGGPVNECSVTSEGRVGVTEETQAAVMERVALGLTRRMRKSLCSEIGARELFEGVRVRVGVAGEREGEGEEREIE